MEFQFWEPIYTEILDDFGFSRVRDEEAALLLSELLKDKKGDLAEVAHRLNGRAAVICGNAPSLAEELGDLPERDYTFVAADGATAVLLRKGIVPDIVVTDLDGPFDAIRSASLMGSIIVVHAHGDNLDALQRYVPQLERAVGTVQCQPPEGLYNFGGFTDGDRCFFLARALGAASIKLLGFDFDDPCVTPRKQKKLLWAKRLIDLALAAPADQINYRSKR
jgi:2-amino-4-hydroxy-6-hydroxymethyldihydropteridine diphosphokinase